MRVTRRRRSGCTLLVAAGVLLALPVLPASAEQAVPPELQATILVRTLGYDRALKSRAGGSVGIGIVYKPGDKASAQVQGDMVRAFKALGSQKVQGLSLSVSTHPFKDPAGLAEWIAQQGIDTLYVAPGLSAELTQIRDVCQTKKVVSMSPVRSFVEQGVAVGIVAKGDTARILVNLGAAESVGMELDSKLLQLSEIVR